ncbi:hypothetical protein MANES_08G159011v8 [Manihot esculenta]|uniref:Uncharacterized protein n=1 Tax=Manihot esculenta TaxID=3983 RepID=A0ACB7HCP8_MANES|nr:hypothetical protein MANES_08G159011v8 [Manihot esculenta]
MMLCTGLNNFFQSHLNTTTHTICLNSASHTHCRLLLSMCCRHILPQFHKFQPMQ